MVFAVGGYMHVRIVKGYETKRLKGSAGGRHLTNDTGAIWARAVGATPVAFPLHRVID